MKTLAGKCQCGKELEFRQTEVREDEDNESSEIMCWLVFGMCEDCEKIWMQMMFKEKIAPTENIDFKIDWNEIVKGTSKKVNN